MKRIDEDIKTGNFKRAYLLYGKEAYLKDTYKNKLIKALVSQGDTMNYVCFSDDNISSGAVIDFADTMPFMAEYRVALIINSGFFKKADDAMAEYLGNVPDTTVLIFVESDVDKRNKSYKNITKYERDIEFTSLSDDVLAQWVTQRLKASSKTISSGVLREFLAYTDCEDDEVGPMNNIVNELDKLIAYTGKRNSIGIEDVRAVCIRHIESKISFDLINAIATKNIKRALDIYNDLLTSKEPPMRILALITRQFRRILLVKEYASMGYNTATIASKIGAREFAVKNDLSIARNMSLEEIKELLEDAVDLEYKFKSGLIDEKLTVELIMNKYAS